MMANLIKENRYLKEIIVFWFKFPHKSYPSKRLPGHIVQHIGRDTKCSCGAKIIEMDKNTHLCENEIKFCNKLLKEVKNGKIKKR